MAWYRNRLGDHLDPNQAMAAAGKRAEALGVLAAGVTNYADRKEARANLELDRNDKAADGGSKEKVAKIKFDETRYKTDGAYKTAVDKEVLANKGKQIMADGQVTSSSISAGAKVKAAGISAGASKYAADRGVENNIRTTSVSADNNIRSTSTQEKTANIYSKAKLDVTDAKEAKKEAKETGKEIDATQSDEDILKKLGKKKGNIGGESIEF